MKIFKVFERAEVGTYMIELEMDFIEKICKYKTVGSYNVFPSRLLGFSYADYLRFVREKFNATLVGRVGTPYPIFKKKVDADNLSNYLNQIWEQYEDKFFNALAAE